MAIPTQVPSLSCDWLADGPGPQAKAAEAV
jgi:hypothetical protein